MRRTGAIWNILCNTLSSCSILYVYAFFCVEANNILFFFSNIHKRDENRCYSSWSHTVWIETTWRRGNSCSRADREIFTNVSIFWATTPRICFNSFTFSVNAFSLRSIQARIFFAIFCLFGFICRFAKRVSVCLILDSRALPTPLVSTYRHANQIWNMSIEHSSARAHDAMAVGKRASEVERRNWNRNREHQFHARSMGKVCDIRMYRDIWMFEPWQLTTRVVLLFSAWVFFLFSLFDKCNNIIQFVIFKLDNGDDEDDDFGRPLLIKAIRPDA